MNVYWLQWFDFDNFVNNGDSVFRSLLTVQIPHANIMVNAALSAFGPGVDLDNMVAGVGGVGIRSSTRAGHAPVMATSLVGHIEVNDCTEVTLELSLKLCSANANGIIYYFE